MANRVTSAVTVKLFFGMVNGLELCMGKELWNTTNVAKVVRFTSLHTNLILSHWPLYHVLMVVQHQGDSCKILDNIIAFLPLRQWEPMLIIQ
jgi:hypothetical protein